MRDSTEKIIEKEFENFRVCFENLKKGFVDMDFEKSEFAIVNQFGGFFDALHAVGEISFEEWSEYHLKLKNLIKEYENKQ